MPIGTNVEGKMVAALRRLGFDKVFDTDFGADLTIVEEGQRVGRAGEKRRRAAHDYLLLPRLGQVLPSIIIRICSDHLSSCKSPQQMIGAVIKTYYAEKNGIDPKDIVSGFRHALHRQKFEIGRDDQDAAGVADVDVAITTRELARMIQRAGIEFTSLPDEEFDSPLARIPAQR